MRQTEQYRESCQSAADAFVRFSQAVLDVIARELAKLDDAARAKYDALVAADMPLFDALAHAKTDYAMRQPRD